MSPLEKLSADLMSQFQRAAEMLYIALVVWDVNWAVGLILVMMTRVMRVNEREPQD